MWTLFFGRRGGGDDEGKGRSLLLPFPPKRNALQKVQPLERGARLVLFPVYILASGSPG